jgi:type IV pilus assembly protein PilX
MNNRVTSLNKQSGVVLVVSLIMLLLLTLVGMTGTQVTSLEEKMASNNRDQNIAFQMAEAALRGGEAQIETIVALSAFNGNNGLLGEDDATPDFSSYNIWDPNNTSSTTFDTGFAQVANQPRFIIKFLGTGVANTGASINIGDYSGSAAGAAVSYFTVTSRGTGGQDSSQVFLRSYYGKRF